jgi:ABC-type transporter Mla subunit MlaD
VIERGQRRSRKRRRIPVGFLVGLLAAAAIFAVGIALGQALHDNPKPNLTVTSTKTLVP